MRDYKKLYIEEKKKRESAESKLRLIEYRYYDLIDRLKTLLEEEN